MDITTAIVVASSATAILGYLGFAPNGPHIIAKAKERIEAPRKRQEALEQKVDGLLDLIERLTENSKSQLKLHNSAVKDVRTLTPQVESLTKLLDEARDQIATLQSTDATMSDGLAGAKADIWRTLAELRQRVEELAATHTEQTEDIVTYAGRLEARIEILERKVNENLGVAGEALRIAQSPTGTQAERFARDYANGPADPRGSDAPIRR